MSLQYRGDAENEDDVGFHRFLQLPIELRLQIWKHTSYQSPRRLIVRDDLIPIRGCYNRTFYDYDLSNSPPPPMQHVCRESRDSQYFVKAFTYVPEFETWEPYKVIKYIWVNFDIDTIILSPHQLSCGLWLNYPRIRFMELNDAVFCQPFIEGYLKNLKHFSNLQSLKILSRCTTRKMWGKYGRGKNWGCEESQVMIYEAEQKKEASLLECIASYREGAEDSEIDDMTGIFRGETWQL